MRGKPDALPREHPPIDEADWCGHTQYISPYGDFEHLDRDKVVAHMNAFHPLPAPREVPPVVVPKVVNYGAPVVPDKDGA